MSNTVIDYRNPSVVREAGMSALKKELGAVGTAYFLRQFSAGQGDYTREREELLDGIAFEDIVNRVRELDGKSAEV
ncbi:MAG: hypothetical protein LBK23_11155 [Oscillospiraceae bacterium]|jgi:hypothetical protein|nr:hypothetical protein [Oscillospiraceae bacterium]